MYKRILAVLIAAALLLALASCGAKDRAATASDATGSDASGGVSTADGLSLRRDEAANAAVVYFSHNDVIKEAAEFAASLRGMDLIEITPQKEYPDDETALAGRIKEEKEKSVRPALKDQPKDLNDYDILFIGFPVWEGTIPMAVATFLEDYDMVDKALVPFCWAPDGEVGESLNDIASLCRYSAITSAYMIPEGDFKNNEPVFEGWMDQTLFG